MLIIERLGDDRTAPYLVRWEDGRESVFVPSCGTCVELHPAQQRYARRLEANGDPECD